MPSLTVDNFEFEAEAFCESCNGLEPYDATYDDDGCDWCLWCVVNVDDAETEELFSISDNEMYKIMAKEKELKIVYFEARVASLKVEI